MKRIANGRLIGAVTLSIQERVDCSACEFTQTQLPRAACSSPRRDCFGSCGTWGAPGELLLNSLLRFFNWRSATFGR